MQEVEKISVPASGPYYKRFPIELFTSVMGVGGLAVAYQQYGAIFNVPLFNAALLATAYLVFGVIGMSYTCKLLGYRSEVAAEFNHPVKANLFAAVSMSFLLLGTATLGFQRSISFALWGIGTVLQLFLVLTITSRWIVREYEVCQSGPVWFLPTAGNLRVPIAGVEFLPKDLCWFFFSIGLVLWLALFTILLYRITFHPALADMLTPTLFILMAPPALAFVAYVRLSGAFDTFAHILLGISIFLVLLFLFLAPHFLKVRFSLAWWAYTFPLCITTTSVTVAYKVSGQAGYAWIASALLVLSSLVVLAVSIKTLAAAKKKTLLCLS